MHPGPRAEYPIITAEEMKKFDVFLFGNTAPTT
jgi:hypothetical protein